MTHPLLDPAPLTAAHFAAIEGRVAALLATEQDVVIMQGEALLPLEGCIRGGARPGDLEAARRAVTEAWRRPAPFSANSISPGTKVGVN